jgi:osmoprotectant transport system permease protein
MVAAAKKIYFAVLILALLVIGVVAERIGLVTQFTDPFEQQYLLGLVGRHLQIVAISMSLALLAGLFIGSMVTRRRFRRFSGIILYVVSLGQTIPSLAVLALIMTVMGIGMPPAIFALFIYSILPIARNTVAGISDVSPALLDAARGIGLSPWQVFFQVELPNALPVILTGVRTALVINVGTVALGSLIGAGGLGDIIFTGINMMQSDKLLAGALPVIAIALAGDYLCEIAGLLFISKGLRKAQSR